MAASGRFRTTLGVATGGAVSGERPQARKHVAITMTTDERVEGMDAGILLRNSARVRARAAARASPGVEPTAGGLPARPGEQTWHLKRSAWWKPRASSDRLKPPMRWSKLPTSS